MFSLRQVSLLHLTTTYHFLFSFNVEERGEKGTEVSGPLNMAIYCGSTDKARLKATGTEDSAFL